MNELLSAEPRLDTSHKSSHSIHIPLVVSWNCRFAVDSAIDSLASARAQLASKVFTHEVDGFFSDYPQVEKISVWGRLDLEYDDGPENLSLILTRAAAFGAPSSSDREWLHDEVMSDALIDARYLLGSYGALFYGMTLGAGDGARLIGSKLLGEDQYAEWRSLCEKALSGQELPPLKTITHPDNVPFDFVFDIPLVASLADSDAAFAAIERCHQIERILRARLAVASIECVFSCYDFVESFEITALSTSSRYGTSYSIDATATRIEGTSPPKSSTIPAEDDELSENAEEYDEYDEYDDEELREACNEAAQALDGWGSLFSGEVLLRDSAADDVADLVMTQEELEQWRARQEAHELALCTAHASGESSSAKRL